MNQIVESNKRFLTAMNVKNQRLNDGEVETAAPKTSRIAELENEVKRLKNESYGMMSEEELNAKFQERESQEKANMQQMQEELTQLSGQVEAKDKELMKYEESMVKLTEEFSVLKDRHSDLENNDNFKSAKLQELQLEMQDLTD